MAICQQMATNSILLALLYSTFFAFYAVSFYTQLLNHVASIQYEFYTFFFKKIYEQFSHIQLIENIKIYQKKKRKTTRRRRQKRTVQQFQLKYHISKIENLTWKAKNGIIIILQQFICGRFTFSPIYFYRVVEDEKAEVQSANFFQSTIIWYIAHFIDKFDNFYQF